MAKSDALLLRFEADDTLSTVSRKTVQKLAGILGFNEHQVVHFALARLRDDLIPTYPADAPELSVKAITTIRSEVIQEGYKSTRTLISGL